MLICHVISKSHTVHFHRITKDDKFMRFVLFFEIVFMKPATEMYTNTVTTSSLHNQYTINTS